LLVAAIGGRRGRRARARGSREQQVAKVPAEHLNCGIFRSLPKMGLDPGYRTSVKVAVVSGTGQVAATTTIYPHEPQRRWDESIARLARLAQENRVELIAIGNGTASRETDQLGAELIRLHPELELTKVVVSEAGAAVYSASAFGSQELPDLDVSLRGAVSIARRFQESLAELVKIDPRSIGVGQYQHDLSEHKLSRSLDAVVEDCVNAVGVDVNTASPPLLSRVSGIGDGLARRLGGWQFLYTEYKGGSGGDQAGAVVAAWRGARPFDGRPGASRLFGGRRRATSPRCWRAG
jgi:uncharacterized protein